MELKLDLSKEYGIVLEGGGAKGSYQIGAWKALKEAGVKIKGIAGTSVGALNGALMCIDDLEKAEYIWDHICYSQVMDVDDKLMESLRARDFKSINLPDLLTDMRKVLRDRGFDIEPLRNLIEEVVDEAMIRNSERELFVPVISLSDRRALVVDMKEAPAGTMADMLMASAYFPAFKLEKLGGKLYTDGGGANNVPVDVLAERGYQDIIIIRIYGIGKDTERHYTVPEGVSVFHIAPRQSLGGILEFDQKKTRKNRKLGYLDGQRMLYGLAGKWYYIDAPERETYYFDRMMSELWLFQSYMGLEFEEEKELKGYRMYTEKLFPKLAKKIGLKEGWDYRELYLSMLEQIARKLRVSRFNVYTVEELLAKIRQKSKSLDRSHQI